MAMVLRTVFESRFGWFEVHECNVAQHRSSISIGERNVYLETAHNLSDIESRMN